MTDQSRLKKEEQESFDGVIKELDNAVHRISGNKFHGQTSELNTNTDSYADIIQVSQGNKDADAKIKNIKAAEKQLYIAHVVLDETDEQTGLKTKRDLFIGKHGYSDNGKIIISSWYAPVSWHYIQSNASINYSYRDKKSGEAFNYHLKNRRDLKILKRVVEEVHELYAEGMNEEEIQRVYYDSFLADLASRRGQSGPSDIIMSIQKEQADIVNEPFDQDLIVQGCAGSGKSMIMLHRLPVILYDEVNQKQRSNVVIISPSKAYIASIENLIYDLEIDDIPKFTLEEYFAEKINYLDKQIGLSKIILPRSNYLVDRETVEQVYSSDMLDSIYGYAIELAQCDIVSNPYLDRYIEKTGDEIPSFESGVLVNCAENRWNYINKVISSDGKCIAVFEKVMQLADMVRTDLRSLIDELKIAQDVLNEKEKSEEDISDEHDNRGGTNIDKTEIEDIEEDDDYIDTANTQSAGGIRDNTEAFNYLTGLSAFVRKIPAAVDDEIIRRNYEIAYGAYKIISEVMQDLNHIKEYLEDINQEAIKNISVLSTDIFKKIINGVSRISKDLNRLENQCSMAQDYSEVFDMLESSHSRVSLCEEILRKVMEEIHDFNKKITVSNSYSFTRYLILWIYLYINYDPESDFKPFSRDRLIMIDEAQTLMPMEIELIKKVNYKVALDLFGDTNQRVPEEKGMSVWPERIIDGYGFKYYELNNNYRNSAAITSFCNKNLNLKMVPVNLPGIMVKTISLEGWGDAVKKVEKELKSRDKEYRTAIIYKRQSVNNALRHIRDDNYCNEINGQNSTITKAKVNFVRVRYVKGVEFDSVIVLDSGKFSKEELYIAYTRALSRLTVIKIEKDNQDYEEPSEDVVNDDKIYEVTGVFKCPECGKSGAKKDQRFYTTKQGEQIGFECFVCDCGAVYMSQKQHKKYPMIPTILKNTPVIQKIKNKPKINNKPAKAIIKAKTSFGTCTSCRMPNTLYEGGLCWDCLQEKRGSIYTD